MRRLAGWFAAVLLVAPVAACGIPGETEVQSRGPGRSAGLAPGDDTTPVRQGRNATMDRAQFVANYLAAAAGEPERALEQVREFLAPDSRKAFKPPQDTQVVRLLEDPLINPGSPEVQLVVEQVGRLNRHGILEPPTTREPRYTVVIKEIEGEAGLFVTKAPPVLLLSDTALEAFYERRAIYFWNADRTALVPDIRYLPRSVPREGQPNEIIDWLTAGPAPWLEGAVEALPEGAERINNVPAARDGKLQINLNGAALPPDDPEAVDRLGAQLMWSLRPNLAAELELRIEHQIRRTFSGTGYLTSNPAYRGGDADLPERFCILNGHVRRVRDLSSHAADPVPVVDNQVNRNVRFAAVGQGGGTAYAALVVAEGEESVLRIGAAPVGRIGNFSRAPLPQPVSRPVWAATPGDPTKGRGLIAAGGRLYGFSSDAVDPRPVHWPSGPRGISAVGVAPDGHRIAVVAGGRVYVSVVTPTNAGLRAAPPRHVRTVLNGVTAVDWGSESSLVVAGVKPDTGRVALMDVSIDGASQVDRVSDLGNAQVSHLVAFAANPVRGSADAEAVVYMANGAAYDVFSAPQRIDPADVAGPPAASDAAPTAPFFRE